MFGIGMPELLVILVIILIIFGAGKLPEIGGAIGKGIKNFKKGMQDDDKSTTEQLKADPPSAQASQNTGDKTDTKSP